MITMTNWATQAVKKLEEERKAIPSIKENEIADKLRNQKTATAAKASLMADAVLKILIDLCKQSEVFSETVVKGGSFADCMQAVTKQLGYYAEGTACCKTAVQFYLPGAEIKIQMEIDLTGTDKEGTLKSEGANVILDLADFLS